jgi:hypothetical protein
LFGGDYSTWRSIAARANDKVDAAARIHSSLAGRINLQSTPLFFLVFKLLLKYLSDLLLFPNASSCTLPKLEF